MVVVLGDGGGVTAGLSSDGPGVDVGLGGRPGVDTDNWTLATMARSSYAHDRHDFALFDDRLGVACDEAHAREESDGDEP